MKITKKAVSFIMSLIFAVSLMFSLLPHTAEASSATKCYTISTGNTTVYSDTGLTRQYGAIYDSDELNILDIKKDYIKVSYPTSRGSKTGYVATNKILLATGGYTYKTTGQITTYKRPGGASYGYASKGDKVIVLGESKGYVQIRYPVSGGYKFGFVTSKDAGKYIYGEDYADISDGTYYFYSAVAGNKALDVSGGKSNDGTNIQLWDANGTDAQKFTVKKQSDGWYKIETAFGKCLDVNKGENKDGANVLQWKWQNSTNQHWKFISAGNGYYYVKSRVGRYLDVNGNVSDNGTNVQLWTKNTSNAQKWKLVGVTNGGSDSSSNIISKADLDSVADSYGIDKGSNAYRALELINTKYAEKLTKDQRNENLVFIFEGVGSSSSSLKRMNAMCIVIKGNKVKYINKNCSTIPDYPFNPSKNGGTAMPTVKSGIYNFTTKNHKNLYAALNVNNAKVVRFNNVNSYYDSESSAINVHRRSSNDIAPSNSSWVNSAGCILIGKSGRSSTNEYAKFIQAVGIVDSGASGDVKYSKSVSGKIIIDRTYAEQYLSNIGYSLDAIGKLK